MTVLCRALLTYLIAVGARDGANAHRLRQTQIKSKGRVLSIEDYGATPDEDDGTWTFFELEEGTSEHHVRPSVSQTTAVLELAQNNTKAFNMALNEAKPGDTVLVPDRKSFTLVGGILADGKHDITIDWAGSGHFVNNRDVWPFDTIPHSSLDEGDGRFDPGLAIYNCTSLTVTSSSTTLAQVAVNYEKNQVFLVNSTGHRGGTINGNGEKWWNDAITGKHKDKRPRLFQIMESEGILVEHITLLNSPYWTLTVEAINSEIRHVNVLVDRKYQSNAAETDAIASLDRHLSDLQIPLPIDDLPDWIGRKFRQPQDLNTDGIDPIGANIWVHDCIIQNADDSVAVKPTFGGRSESRLPDCTNNITIENMVLTGFGASVGSLPAHEAHKCIDNITFRNISMPGTGKGIYIKSDWGIGCHNGTGQISNILYEDIEIHQPFWWPIWIGPQQQHQPNSKLNKKCALTWPVEPHCPTPGCIQMENITIRNVRVHQPLISPAVIMGNKTSHMKNIVFEDIIVKESKTKFWYGKWPFHQKRYPWHGKMKCVYAEGTYNNSHPAPLCLTKI